MINLINQTCIELIVGSNTQDSFIIYKWCKYLCRCRNSHSWVHVIYFLQATLYGYVSFIYEGVELVLGISMRNQIQVMKFYEKYVFLNMTKERLYATCKNASLNWGCTCRYILYLYSVKHEYIYTGLYNTDKHILLTQV